jgi:hypothetical protein
VTHKDPIDTPDIEESVQEDVGSEHVDALTEDETYKPPRAVRAAAQRALDVRAEKPPSQRGMTSVGLGRARDLASGRPVSVRTLRRMRSFFARHEVDKSGSTWSEKGKGWQAWHGWGGDPGRAWANKILKKDTEKKDSAESVQEDVTFERVDAVQELPAPQWTAEGYLKTRAFTARPGIYVYHEDGREIRELVPRETLHSRESLDSLAMKPVTLLHPPTMLTKSNAAEYAVGAVGENPGVSQDGRTYFTILVTDDAALAAAKAWNDAGEVLGTSPGYKARVDNTPGNDPEFGAYDRKQIGRLYNHLALTPRPRGGSGVHFRMDGVPELSEALHDDTENNDMTLIEQLLELGYDRQDAETIADLEQGTALIEKSNKFDATPDVDLDAQKADRIADRKERRELVSVAAEFKLDEQDDFDIDVLDNSELKGAILSAAGAPEPRLDGIPADVAVALRYDTFLAFRKDSSNNDDAGEDRADDNMGVEYARTDADQDAIFDAWAPKR